ncbi:pyridoxal phosphate enzyme (YggS family) [Methylohalomonas lacus]|uniref:Pyridoxal phosphate homeostasis protein n=1 Tax=Methylohalomonas lacus TaxID=398773 RepID=A0AAE3HLN4_9GAMM|nr:YggS family pyridoxal phosphate-dependent enzyme [Methylohalomonas lacus]MCS3903262.1 pyridoxal phosphate enzyme (YggS family) [Methylohalomonas lacus]
MKNIAQSLTDLRHEIAACAREHGRDATAVSLLAVSKKQPVAAIRAALDAGQTDFGENYLQEALDKMTALADSHACWHFIGPLQSNKTRAVAEHFDWVHTLDRDKVARRLSEQRPADRPPLNVCIQVNISAEASKSGVDPARLPELAATISSLPGLRLRGLMALPAPTVDFEAQRRPFRQLRETFEQLRAGGLELDTLSLGTSADFAAAIAEGSTLVRLGTAVFGARPG